MSATQPNISFWEKQFVSHTDIIILGAGIVGLQSASLLKRKFPHRQVWVLDRAPFGLGASMRNAGFACFGSMGEILDDAERTSFSEALALYEKRFQGIKLLLEKYKETKIGYEKTGGYEVFTPNHTAELGRIMEHIDGVNEGLKSVTGSETFMAKSTAFSGMNVLNQGIHTPFEGALQTHLLYKAIRSEALALGVEIFTGMTIERIEQEGSSWKLISDKGLQIGCRKLVLCTNAFTQKFLPEIDIQPARGQVLVTSHIPSLKWRGIMHADKGYIYFRSLGTRILIGGARNMDFEGETTFDIDVNETIVQKLISFLKETVVPLETFTITDSWSGIMGMANDRGPIVKEHQAGLFVCARMGGMGVALSAQVAQDLVALIE